VSRSALLVTLARFISRTGGEAAFFVGLWGKAAYEFDATAGQIATLIAVMGIAGLIGSGVAGPMIDRFGPRKVLMASEIVFVPATISAVMANDLTPLIGAAAAIALFGAPAYTAIASFPPFLTESEDELAKINAWVEMAGMAALISGASLGAVMAATVGIDAIFWFDGATSLVAVALVARVATGRPVKRAGDLTGWKGALQGFSTVYRNRRLRFFVLAGTAVWSAFGFFGALEPLFYRDILAVGPEMLGVVNTIFGIGLLAGTVGAGRLPKRWRTARMVAVLVGLNGVGALIYVGTTRLPVVFVGAITWGLIIGVMAPLARTMVHVNSPEGQVGRVMGVSQVHSEVAKLGPLILAPPLAAAVGVQQALIWSGVSIGLLALIMTPAARRLDQDQSGPVPTIQPAKTSDEPISPNP
jgi:MFS transporter, DHA3 family, macrolide efflux protein